MMPEIDEPMLAAPLYSAFRCAIENRWCVSISCKGCGAFYFRQELFTALQIGSQGYDKFSKPVFPGSLQKIQWQQKQEHKIFDVLDQWLDVIWDTERFDQRVIDQLFVSKAEKFARELSDDIKNLHRDHPFWGFIDSLSPNWSYSSLEDVKQAKFGAQNIIKEAKWVLLSGIESLSNKFETMRANHLKDRLQVFELEHPEVGWQYSHRKSRRSVNPSGIAYARRDRQLEKREFLEQFGLLSDLDKLKTIAKPDFGHRLEFIPVEMIPNIFNISNAPARFSQEERQKLIDWIGQKSGRWSIVRRELQKPYLIKSGDALG